MLDPFRFALDATYGRVDLGEGLSTKGKKIDVKREGWIVSALAEYKMESVTPGLTAWYSSGDDANVNNGSERLPTINPDVKVTSYGFDGTNFCRAQQVLGTSVDGTFGIVAHLKDISFFEDLSHTLRVAFYRGTNNTENVRQKMITKPSETVSSMYYMTTADKAWEVNVDSEYKIYKNLSLFLELGYIRMDLDSNVWKDYESKRTTSRARSAFSTPSSGFPSFPRLRRPFLRRSPHFARNPAQRGSTIHSTHARRRHEHRTIP